MDSETNRPRIELKDDVYTRKLLKIVPRGNIETYLHLYSLMKDTKPDPRTLQYHTEALNSFARQQKQRVRRGIIRREAYGGLLQSFVQALDHAKCDFSQRQERSYGWGKVADIEGDFLVRALVYDVVLWSKDHNPHYETICIFLDEQDMDLRARVADSHTGPLEIGWLKKRHDRIRKRNDGRFYRLLLALWGSHPELRKVPDTVHGIGRGFFTYLFDHYHYPKSIRFFPEDAYHIPPKKSRLK